MWNSMIGAEELSYISGYQMLTMDKNWLTYNRVKEARKKWLHILCDHSRNAVKGTQRTYMVLG